MKEAARDALLEIPEERDFPMERNREIETLTDVVSAFINEKLVICDAARDALLWRDFPTFRIRLAAIEREAARITDLALRIKNDTARDALAEERDLLTLFVADPARLEAARNKTERALCSANDAVRDALVIRSRTLASTFFGNDAVLEMAGDAVAALEEIVLYSYCEK